MEIIKKRTSEVIANLRIFETFHLKILRFVFFHFCGMRTFYVFFVEISDNERKEILQVKRELNLDFDNLVSFEVLSENC